VIGPNVNVHYDCRYCDTRDVVVEVPERYPTERLISWIELVRMMVARHHGYHSAHCASSEVDLKIPLPTGDVVNVGQAVRN
jgi:hypothetical protein